MAHRVLMTHNIDVPHDDCRCAFCDYLAGNRPFTIIWRTDVIATLITREQRGEPHLLVIPVRHAPTILDLTREELVELAVGVQTAAIAIDKVYTKPGIAVWQNNGVPAHQAIPHVHFHVAGTLPDGGTNWDEVREFSVAETDYIAKRLLAAS